MHTGSINLTTSVSVIPQGTPRIRITQSFSCDDVGENGVSVIGDCLAAVEISATGSGKAALGAVTTVDKCWG